MKNYDTIDLYINEISELLPYPVSKKKDKLEELRIDVQAAVEDSDIKNPSIVFGSPRDVAKKFSQSQYWGTQRAGWSSRFLAWLIDTLIISLFFLVYGLGGMIVILSLFVPVENIRELFDNLSNSLQLNLSLPEIIIFLILQIFLLGSLFTIYVGYTIALERYFATTIGKKLLKLSVVDESGIKITWYQAIIRNISKISGGFLPIDFIIGVILEKKDPDKTMKQRALDVLAETIVIKHK